MVDFGRIGTGLATGGASEGVNLATGGGLFNKKKVKPIDITQQLAQVRKNASVGRGLVEGQYQELQPLTAGYETDTAKALQKARADAEAQKAGYLGDTAAITEEAKNALRANLYSDTFSGLPDTLKAVREAAAAGSGINSGAYQQAVGDVGVNTARTLATGERDIQLQGLQNRQQAQDRTYETFANLTSKLGDQEMNVLTKALDTRRADVVQRTAQQLGLNETETQAILDLLNFQASGQLASESAEAAGQQQLLNTLLSAGGQVAGSAIKGK